jgi:DNA mismatch repair ATPase MutS
VLTWRRSQEDFESHELGICFVDSSRGAFYLTHISDDLQHSQFETLLVQIRPKEFVFPKARASLCGRWTNADMAAAYRAI